jgi:hypothetical protein
MSNSGTFAGGFTAGWQSIMGPGVAIPVIPAHAVPTGTTAYDHGLTKGIEAAYKRKAEMESKKSN